MRIKSFPGYALSLCMLFLYSTTGVAQKNNQLPLKEFIANVLENYPTLDVAALAIQQAKQEFAKVEGQLGWVINAQAGLSHDVSIIDSPTNQYMFGLGLNRRYESGNSLELSGAYSRDESDTSFSPSIPNPAQRAQLDLKYRIPLARGEGNPDYKFGLNDAESNLNIQKASQTLIIDSLMQEAIILYFDSLSTYIRIKDAEHAIQRAERLLAFINKNRKLGLAEEKDVLRVLSQKKRQIAQRDTLEVAWQRQRTELNKLMGQPSGQEIVPVIEQYTEMKSDDSGRLLEVIYTRNPELALQEGQLSLAESAIERSRDARKSKMDLVLSVGSRSVRGDTVTGDVESDELVGGVQFEYSYELDRNGVDAALYQSLLQRDQAKKEISRIKDDLGYQFDGLIRQLKANERAVRSAAENYQIEEKKMEEALKRYREGRASTNEIVDFEESLQVSYLLQQNQKVALARNNADIALLLGHIWQENELEKRSQTMPYGELQQ